MKILIADDDAVTCRYLEQSLSKCGHEIVVCSNGADAWQILQEPDAPKLAILDWMMPGLEGPEICRKLRRFEKDRYTYLILLTVRTDKSDIVAGINAGANDYITKPFDIMELKARLNAAIRNLRVHEELLAAQEMLKAEAMKDGLTGIQNHAAIVESLKKELSRAAREQSTVGVALVDLDAFKAVNDTYGHLAGDEMIREAVRRISDQLRRYDAIGRYGGDEFLIVLPDCNIEKLWKIAERIRQAVADTPAAAQNEIKQTISVGITTTEGMAPTNINAIIQAADVALYAAKRNGRNRVEIYSPSQPQFASSTTEPAET